MLPILVTLYVTKMGSIIFVLEYFIRLERGLNR